MRNVLVSAPPEWRNMFTEPVPQALRSHPGFENKTTRRVPPSRFGFLSMPVAWTGPMVGGLVLLDCVVRDDWTPPPGWTLEDDRSWDGRGKAVARMKMTATRVRNRMPEEAGERPAVAREPHRYAGWPVRDFE